MRALLVLLLNILLLIVAVTTGVFLLIGFVIIITGIFLYLIIRRKLALARRVPPHTMIIDAEYREIGEE